MKNCGLKISAAYIPTPHPFNLQICSKFNGESESESKICVLLHRHGEPTEPN